MHVVECRKVIDKTLTPNPIIGLSEWTTQMDYPKMDYT